MSDCLVLFGVGLAITIVAGCIGSWILTVGEGMSKESTMVRQIQLVAREAVLTQILQEYRFPTPKHKEVVELLCQEVRKEMKDLGLEEVKPKVKSKEIGIQTNRDGTFSFFDPEKQDEFPPSD